VSNVAAGIYLDSLEPIRLVADKRGSSFLDNFLDSKRLLTVEREGLHTTWGSAGAISKCKRRKTVGVMF
jgi:hypothetical protein